MTIKEYLADHSLNEVFIKKSFGVSFPDDYTIQIPVYSPERKFLYNRYRHLQGEAKFTSDPGAHPALYAAHTITQKQEVVLAEGEPDTMRLWQEGIPAVTGTSGVKTFTKDLAAPLSGKTVYITLDNDEAGQSAVTKYYEILTQANADPRILTLPSHFKDVSEYFTAGYSQKDFRKLQKDSLSLDEWILKRGEEKYPIVNNKEYLNTHFPEEKWLMEEMVVEGGVTLFVGEGGVGKTLIAINIAKHIAEGSKWIDTFPTKQSKILFIDKENTHYGRQQYFKSMQVYTDNIYNYMSPADFSIIDSQGQLTEASEYLSLFIKHEGISVVVLDSLVDFFVGSENDSVDVGINFAAWQRAFPNCTIIAIHHESKPQQNAGNRFSGHRVRGSTHMVNYSQSILSFSLLDREYSEKILVEHTKVRGAKKHDPFEIEMKIETNPEDPEGTIVTGFKFLGNVVIQKRKSDEAVEAVIDLLERDPERHFTTKDIEIELQGVVENSRNIKSALPKLRENNLVAYDISKQPYEYWCLPGEESGEEDPKDVGSFLTKLEKGAAQG